MLKLDSSSSYDSETEKLSKYDLSDSSSEESRPPSDSMSEECPEGLVDHEHPVNEFGKEGSNVKMLVKKHSEKTDAEPFFNNSNDDPLSRIRHDRKLRDSGSELQFLLNIPESPIKNAERSPVKTPMPKLKEDSMIDDPGLEDGLFPCRRDSST